MMPWKSKAQPLPPMQSADVTIKEMERQLMHTRSLLYTLSQSTDIARRRVARI